MQNKTEEIGEFELVGYFNSTLNNDENERVENWIARSDENKAIANEVYTVILANDALHTMDKLSPREALKKVNRRILSAKVRLCGIWMQRTAAILFIPLFLSVAYLLIKERNSETEYISFRTNPGIVADFNLPDGSKVWLNSQSSLRYPARFKKGGRDVQLSGEAYFHVKKNEKQPFYVTLKNDVKIEVTGTEFNVDAYERNTIISAMLVSGGVNIRYPHETGDKVAALKPGQKIIIEKETGNVSLSYASALVETGWKDGKVFLENTPLEHLLYTLSKRFNVDFVLNKEKLRENYFTGTFGTQELDLILKHLEISSGIKHEIKMPANDATEARAEITLF